MGVVVTTPVLLDDQVMGPTVLVMSPEIVLKAVAA
jgi:hypothetical protein